MKTTITLLASASILALASCDSTSNTRDGAREDAEEIKRDALGDEHVDREKIADRLEDLADDVRDVK